MLISPFTIYSVSFWKSFQNPELVAYGFNLSNVVIHPQAVVYRQQRDLMLRINMEFLRTLRKAKKTA